MNVSAPFIARPVATTLLTIGVTLAGILAFFKLPVAPLPQVEFPTISVQAVLPGASPDTVATTVASPLERHLGQIAGVMEMTSSSILSEARVGVQFDLTRDLDGAARDVQAAINAARIDLPTNLRSNPIYRKVNPSDFPILILALTSKTLMQGQLFDAASTVLQQRLSQVEGVGQAIVGGSALPGVRVEINPEALSKYMGLADAAHRRAATYSGGMIRRLELAQALVNAPRLLVLDEPTVGLDPIARTDVWDYITKLRDEFGMTVLMTTHYMDEADIYCDRLALMHLGHIRATGTPG